MATLGAALKMSILLSSCLLLSVANAQFQGQNYCPHGFTQHGKSCYLLVQSLNKWTDAQYYCQLLNSHLVKVDNVGENKFITQFIQALAQTPDLSVWTSATNILGPNYWVWISDRSPLTFTSWEDSQGHTQQGLRGVVTNNGSWTAELCERSHFFLCEMEIDGIVVG